MTCCPVINTWFTVIIQNETWLWHLLMCWTISLRFFFFSWPIERCTMQFWGRNFYWKKQMVDWTVFVFVYIFGPLQPLYLSKVFWGLPLGTACLFSYVKNKYFCVCVLTKLCSLENFIVSLLIITNQGKSNTLLITEYSFFHKCYRKLWIIRRNVWKNANHLQQQQHYRKIASAS